MYGLACVLGDFKKINHLFISPTLPYLPKPGRLFMYTCRVAAEEKGKGKEKKEKEKKEKTW
jgi:hypothetical protein